MNYNQIGGINMKYIAVVKQSRNGYLKHIESDYNNKKDFTRDLRNNDYRVIAILTDKEIGQIKDNDLNIICKYKYLDFDYVKQCL